VLLLGLGVAGLSTQLGQATAEGTTPSAKVLIWIANVGLFALTLAALAVRRCDARLCAWLFGSVVVGVAVLQGFAPKSPALALGYVAVGVGTARVSTAFGVVLGSVSIVGILSADLFTSGSTRPGEIIAYVGVVFIAIGARERDMLRASESRNQVLAERARIAREIHDILAHSLSAQIVHLEGARLLLDRDGDREQVRDRVDRAQRLARSGLEETRRALVTLRGDAPAPDEAIAALAEEFRASTGRHCDVEVIGPSRELSPEAGLAVVRTAQEALTNVRRHAPQARAVVRLRYLPTGVVLEVTDTGGPSQPSEGSGYGLVGMRERAELIGGTLEAGTHEGGFRVRLEVPA
jgi:signal transduction histidine kinase